ncbi:MAG: glycosyltransferase [Lachnospiraceae bacterium]|nr:glycosyltransferase [Lachnospiraceae bacterium]
MINHTFAICAYKESEFLEECIMSLKNQTIQSKIIICTSTDNEYIRGIAEKYELPLYINKGESGITQDWNFALSCVKTKYATIAHQDDTYEPKYTRKVIGAMRKSEKPLIAFTDYYELRNGNKVKDNTLLKIKRIMLLPLRVKPLWKSVFVRRRVLSLGNAICCPSVTFCLKNVNRPVFIHGFRSNEDWQAWEKLSKLRGEFVYINAPLMCHRIHEGSETSQIIGDNARSKEDYEMYKCFWPDIIAKFLSKAYANSEKSNKL